MHAIIRTSDGTEGVYMGTSPNNEFTDYILLSTVIEGHNKMIWKTIETCTLLYYVDDRGRKYDGLLNPIKEGKKKKL